MRRLIPLLLALVALVALTGCVGLGGAEVEEPADDAIGKRNFEVKASDFYHDLEGLVRDTYRDDLVWKNGKGVATLEIFRDMAEGQERVVVVDGAGKAIWEKTFGAGSAYEIFPLGSGAKGDWHVVMDRQGVSGSVKIHLFQRAA